MAPQLNDGTLIIAGQCSRFALYMRIIVIVVANTLRFCSKGCSPSTVITNIVMCIIVTVVANTLELLR